MNRKMGEKEYALEDIFLGNNWSAISEELEKRKEEYIDTSKECQYLKREMNDELIRKIIGTKDTKGIMYDKRLEEIAEELPLMRGGKILTDRNYTNFLKSDGREKGFVRCFGLLNSMYRVAQKIGDEKSLAKLSNLFDEYGLDIKSYPVLYFVINYTPDPLLEAKQELKRDLEDTVESLKDTVTILSEGGYQIPPSAIEAYSELSYEKIRIGLEKLGGKVELDDGREIEITAD